MKSIKNSEIAKIFYEISEYLKIQGIAFKPRAYEKVADVISSLQDDLNNIYKEDGLKALESIPGVGKSIALKIEELLKTGKLKYYQKLKKKTPIDLSELAEVEGLGPKNIKILYEKLGIRTTKQLERAAKSGKVGRLEGFGKKSEENILRGLEYFKQSRGRRPLAVVLPQAEVIEKRLRRLRGVKKAIVAGSLRRRKKTIGDIDIVVSAKPTTGKKIIEFFVSMPEVSEVFAKGTTKASVKLKSGLDADLRVIPEESYGAALHYFTGPKDHNIALRRLALKKGYKLNEYGLFKDKKQIAGRTEESIYKALGLDYIDPEKREEAGD